MTDQRIEAIKRLIFQTKEYLRGLEEGLALIEQELPELPTNNSGDGK